MRDQLIAAGLWEAADDRDPSASIAAAWAVVEHLRGRVVIDHWWANEYRVMIYIPSSGRLSVEASASTAPEAICRAALEAVKVATSH